jgi:hypothetical protein
LEIGLMAGIGVVTVALPLLLWWRDQMLSVDRIE